MEVLFFFAGIINLVLLIMFIIMGGNVSKIKKQQIEHFSKLQKNQEVLRKTILKTLDAPNKEAP